MRSTASRSLRRWAIALSASSALWGCASAPLSIRVSVDCPVLGKELRMADDAKAWVLQHQDDAPPSVLAFTNAVGDHNEKVQAICRGEMKP